MPAPAQTDVYHLTRANGHPCKQGADFLFKLKFWADAAKTTPVDLGGYIATMQVREYHASATTILDLASNGATPRIALGGASGEVTVALPYTVTAELPAPFKGKYDLKLTPPIGPSQIRLVEGDFEITPQVTRPVSV